MRKIAYRGIWVAGWIVAASLTACGGDDSGDSLSLTSKSDVLREIGVLDASMDFVASSAEITSKRGAVTSGMPLAMKRASAAAKDTQQCGAGGSVETDSGTRTRSFRYIDTQQRDVDYQRTLSKSCHESHTAGSTSYSLIEGGLVENGENADGSISYSEAGQGGPAYSLYFERAESGVVQARTDYSTKGIQETRSSGSFSETLATINSEFSNLENGVTIDGNISMGSSQQPFRTAQNLATGELSLDGSYHYSTSACSGGAVEIVTSTPLTGNLDDTGYYATGGSIHLDVSDGGASVTFNNDGSASYQLDDGSVGILTRAEIDQQLLHPCG